MKKNLKLQKLVRMLLALASSVFLVIMIWIIIDCFTFKTTASKKIISYNVKDGLDYEVILKNNQFYTNEEANLKNVFIPSLIDKLQLHLNYELVGSNFFDSDYSYEVVTTLKSVKDGKVIWKYKNSPYAKETRSSYDTMKVEINDYINVDMSNLYSMADEFYKMTNCDVVLEIDVNIGNDLKVVGYEKQINDQQVLSMTIPITDKVVSISRNNGNMENKKVFDQYVVNEQFNSSLFILACLLTISLIPVAVMSYASLFNLTNLDDYKRNLKKLNTKYGKMFKKVSNEPKVGNKELLEYDNIQELIVICKEKDLNISVYERYPGRECWFYVDDDKKIHLYILKLNYREIDMRDTSAVIKLPKKNKNRKKSK